MNDYGNFQTFQSGPTFPSSPLYIATHGRKKRDERAKRKNDWYYPKSRTHRSNKTIDPKNNDSKKSNETVKSHKSHNSHNSHNTHKSHNSHSSHNTHKSHNTQDTHKSQSNKISEAPKYQYSTTNIDEEIIRIEKAKKYVKKKKNTSCCTIS